MQYAMPDDNDYALTPVAEYLLPVGTSASADIAQGSTLFWMVVNNQVWRAKVAFAGVIRSDGRPVFTLLQDQEDRQLAYGTEWFPPG